MKTKYFFLSVSVGIRSFVRMIVVSRHDEKETSEDN